MADQNQDTEIPVTKQANTARWIGGLSILSFAVFLAVVLGTGLNLDPTSRESVMLGKKAFDFQGSWIQGSEFASGDKTTMNLNNFLGKPVIVNFWASWCVSCRSEAGELEKFWRAHGKEVAVVGVAVQDEEQSALAFARQFGKTYPLGLDQSGKAGIEYGVTGVPETFFISADGIIIQKHVGPVTVKLMEEWIKK